MKIYLGGSFIAQRRLRPVRDRLFELGHSVISTWLDEVQKPDNMPKDVFDRQLAVKDLTEVKEADCIIMDKFEASTTGGRNVEWGYALANTGKLKYVVGPVTSIFEQLADGVFDSWDELFEFFQLNHPTTKYVATGMENKEFTKAVLVKA